MIIKEHVCSVCPSLVLLLCTSAVDWILSPWGGYSFLTFSKVRVAQQLCTSSPTMCAYVRVCCERMFYVCVLWDKMWLTSHYTSLAEDYTTYCLHFTTDSWGPQACSQCFYCNVREFVALCHKNVHTSVHVHIVSASLSVHNTVPVSVCMHDTSLLLLLCCTAVFCSSALVSGFTHCANLYVCLSLPRCCSCCMALYMPPCYLCLQLVFGCLPTVSCPETHCLHLTAVGIVHYYQWFIIWMKIMKLKMYR